MDWLATIGVMITVAGLICVVVIGVVAFDLRRHMRRGLDEVGNRQAQLVKRMAEGLTALQQEQRDAHGQIQQLVRQQRKLMADIADLYDRIGEGKGGEPPTDGDRFLH